MHLNVQYYREIKDYKTFFEKQNKVDLILTEYEKLNREIDIKNAEKAELMERFQDLVDDFILYSEEGVFKDQNPADLQERIKQKHNLESQKKIDSHRKIDSHIKIDEHRKKSSTKLSENVTEIQLTPPRKRTSIKETEGKISTKKTTSNRESKKDYVSAEELNKEILDLKRKLEAVEVESSRQKYDSHSLKGGSKIRSVGSISSIKKADVPRQSDKKKPPSKRSVNSSAKEQ